MKNLFISLAMIALALSASAERQPFERYQTIVNRQMFGPPPDGFDPTKPPSEVVSSHAAAKLQQEQAKVQEKLKSAIHFSMINVTPSGEIAVGFTEKGEKGPVNYYLKKNERSGNGRWTVVEADPVSSTMTIVNSEGIEVSLTLGGDSAKGAGKTTAVNSSGFADRSRGADAPDGSSLRRQRKDMRRANEELLKRLDVMDATNKKLAEQLAEKNREDKKKYDMTEELFARVNDLQEKRDQAEKEKAEKEKAEKEKDESEKSNGEKAEKEGTEDASDT